VGRRATWWRSRIPFRTRVNLFANATCDRRSAEGPNYEVVLAGAAKAGAIERCAVGVVSYPVQLGPVGEQVLGGASLPARAGVPERLGNLASGQRPLFEQLLHAVEHAQRRGVPELVHPGAASDQQPGDMPAAVADRVVQRGADGPAPGSPAPRRRRSVRPRLRGHRCSPTSAAASPGDHRRSRHSGRPRRKQQHNRGWCGGKVARPIRGGM
jgi:hypothetical protein